MMNKKSNRMLCILLSCMMLFSVLPVVATAATGEASAVLPAGAPSGLPDGKPIDAANLWVDWDTAGVTGAKVEDGYNKVTTKDKTAWTDKGVDTVSWKGASGIMFYVDASKNAGNVDFLLELLLNTSRPKSATANSYAQLKTTPTAWASPTPIQVGNTSHAYYFKDGAWVDFSVSYPSYYLSSGAKNSGWYYVPFESFWYHGGSGNGYDVASTGILNFNEFMSHYQNQTIWKISMKSNQVGQKFGDVYFVYSNPENVTGDTAVSPLFGTMALNGKPDGTATGNVSDNAVTVTGGSSNSATASGNRVWLTGLAQTNLSGASGLRFRVDTASADAQVQLRLRMIKTDTAAIIKDVYAAGAGGYASLSGGWMQYVCRSENSVIYYYDAGGNAQALRISSSVNTGAEGDLFEALPAGYQGYVYVPFENFWLSITSYNNLICNIPFADAIAKYGVNLFGICSAVSGGDSDSVTYSNFEVVWADTAMTGAGVSLTNNLNVNFYAKVQENATDAKMYFKVGSRNTEVAGIQQEDGSWKFVCADLLPQTVVDTIHATLSATVNGTTISQKKTYSVREYCERQLANAEASNGLKKLLVDLLYYAEAAQLYANYRTDDLATKNLTEAQKALRSADTTGAITATAGKTGTPDETCGWTAAALRLENAMAMKLRFDATTVEGLTVDVTINGRTVTISDFGEENGTYYLLFNNIGADEYNAEVRAVFKRNGTETGEVLTYSVAAYIGEAVRKAGASEALLNLLRSIYAYGESATAYTAG